MEYVQEHQHYTVLNYTVLYLAFEVADDLVDII